MRSNGAPASFVSGMVETRALKQNKLKPKTDVRVGIMVTHNPLYGSRQAGLPHPALTSGDNAHAAQGIRMTSTGGRQPAVDQAPHPVPTHSGFLAAPQERAMPEPTYLEPKRVQRRAVGRLSVITNVSTYASGGAFR